MKFDLRLKLDDGKVFVGTGEGAYEATSPPPLPGGGASLDLCWIVDANPKQPFCQSQGTIPVGPNKGKEQELVGICEAMWDENGSDGAVTHYALDKKSERVSPTAVYHGPNEVWIDRTVDPVRTNGWVYRAKLNKRAVGWKPNKGDSFRAEVGSTGKNRYMPWGTEEMCTSSVYLPADPWAKLGPEESWYVFFQWHDAEGGLTHNPPAAVYWDAGPGPGKGRFNVVLRAWNGDAGGGNKIVASASIPATPDEAHFFLAHYVTGAGEGFRGEAEPFFDMYYVSGDGTKLQKVLSYKGKWGSPNPTNKEWPGFWRGGNYASTPFPVSDDRPVYSGGFRQYLVSSFPPGTTVSDVLNDFKESRK